MVITHQILTDHLKVSIVTPNSKIRAISTTCRFHTILNLVTQHRNGGQRQLETIHTGHLRNNHPGTTNQNPTNNNNNQSINQQPTTRGRQSTSCNRSITPNNKQRQRD